MVAHTLILSFALALATPKGARQDQKKPIVVEQKIAVAEIVVSGTYSRGKNKKLEKIMAVASVPFTQMGKNNKVRKKGESKVTVLEAKNGKRKVTLKNITKTSPLYGKLMTALHESIEFYKQHHQDPVKSRPKK